MEVIDDLLAAECPLHRLMNELWEELRCCGLR
jgi:hypothetical protein